MKVGVTLPFLSSIPTSELFVAQLFSLPTRGGLLLIDATPSQAVAIVSEKPPHFPPIVFQGEGGLRWGPFCKKLLQKLENQTHVCQS